MRIKTDEQNAIVAQAKGAESLMINAYAGCAKSTTLEMLGEGIYSPTLALAFNKKIAEDMKGRFKDNFVIKTMNSLGYGAWSQALGKRLLLDDKKVSKIISEIAKEWKIDLSSETWFRVKNLVEDAMNYGIVPQGLGKPGLLPDEAETWFDLGELSPDQGDGGLVVEIAREALSRSLILAKQGTVSFADQIYCPTFLGGIFPRFPTLFVDEAQDLSLVNHKMLELCKPERLVVVGDKKQAIYAFRGADGDSMGKISALQSSWLNLPLTMTFRCPKEIVYRQQNHAPGFRAADWNRDGKVVNLGKEWNWEKISTLANGRKVAVLCRNNAPLMKIGFRLIRSGIGVIMLGRDLGKNLTLILDKIDKKESLSIVEFVSKLKDWQERELDIAKANKQEYKLESVQDKFDCIMAVVEESEVKESFALRQAIEVIFSGFNGKIVLSTGHKAKGLEWEVVVHLDPWRLPSKGAAAKAALGDGKELEQELNLIYVIETRTKDLLINVNLEQMEVRK